MENTFENKENVIGKVYKLTCKDETVTDCYIGSTINLYSRLHKHKNNSVNENSEKHHLKVYKKIRECGGWENWKCEVLDEILNPTRSQLIALERVYYEENIDNATLNSVYCGRTPQEAKDAWWKKNPEYMVQYRENNTEKIKEYNDNYYRLNREKILTNWRQKVKCECGCVVNKSCLIRHKKTNRHKKNMENITT